MTYKYLGKERAFLIENTDEREVKIGEEAAKRLAIFYLRPLLMEIGATRKHIYTLKYGLDELLELTTAYIREVTAQNADLRKALKRANEESDRRAQTLFDFVGKSVTVTK